MNKGAYLFLCSLALIAGWMTAKLVPRIPPRGDPQRFLWAQVLLYAGTFAIVAVSVLARLLAR